MAERTDEVFEPRQALGIAFLLLIGLFVFLGDGGGHPTNLLKDLDGSFGLSLLLAAPLLAPRRMLIPVYILVAIGFLAMGIRWLLLAIGDRSKDGYPLPTVFLLTGVLFVFFAYVTKRRNKAEQTPEHLLRKE